MKIFQVIESSTNISLSNNKTWYRNLYEPLLDLGHEVVFFPAEDGRAAMMKKDDGLKKSFSQKMVETFKTEHKKKPFDLAFFYFMDGMFEPWSVEEIRSSNVICTNFSCNNIHQFYLVEKISHLFDLNLYSEKDAKEKFDGIGVKSLWWPMASNPKYFRPIECKREIEASFVGGRYANRFDSIYQLLLSGVDAHAFGPNWQLDDRKKSFFYRYARWGMHIVRMFPMLQNEKRADEAIRYAQDVIHQYAIQKFPKNFHQPISDEGMVELYGKSHITLGFLDVFEHHNFTGRRLRHLHLRDFEACMAGALYCTDYSDELAEMFEPDKEVLACKDMFEKIEKIKYFISHENNANDIRTAARKRALTEHTYHHRFNYLFEHLRIK